MSEHKRERRYKFTVTLPPRKPRKPLSPETKRVLKEIWGWAVLAICAIGGWFILGPVIREVMKIFSS